jgi:hypothetical protein
MKHRTRALAVGLLGLAVAVGVATWLHVTNPGGFPSIPGPGDLEPIQVAPVAVIPAPAAFGPRPAVVAPHPSASAAPPVPPQVPRAAPSSATTPPLPRAADVSRPSGREDPGQRLHDEALARPEDPNRWVAVGGYWLEHSRPDEGRAALRRAWSVATTPEARETVLGAWRRHGLPPQGLDPTAPALRSGGFEPAPKLP